MSIDRQLWNKIWASGGTEKVRDMAEYLGMLCPICGNFKQTGDGRVFPLNYWRSDDGKINANMECGRCHHQWQVTK